MTKKDLGTVDKQIEYLKNDLNISISDESQAKNILKNNSFFHFIQQSKFNFCNAPYAYVITSKENAMLTGNIVNIEKYPNFKQEISYTHTTFKQWLSFYEKNVEATSNLATKILSFERSLFNYISNIIYQKLLSLEDKIIIKCAKNNSKFFMINKKKLEKQGYQYPLTDESRQEIMKNDITSFLRSLGIPEMKEILNTLDKNNVINLQNKFGIDELDKILGNLSKKEKFKRISLIIIIRNQIFHGKLITYNFRQTNDIHEKLKIYKSFLNEEYDKYEIEKLVNKGNIYTIWKLAQKSTD